VPKDIQEEVELENEEYVEIRSEEDFINLFNFDNEPWYKGIYYGCHYLALEYLSPYQLHRRLIRWPLQRLTRGFDDRELWNLDSTIAKLIVPRLKVFIKQSLRYGYPSVLEEDGKSGHEKWDAILAEMLWSFEYALASYGEDWDDYPRKDRKAQEILSDRYKSGMKLFSKYCENLWQ